MSRITFCCGLWLLLWSVNCRQEDEFLPFEFIMGTQEYPLPSTGQPAKGRLYQDPTFLTTIERITEKADGYAGPGIENEYSRADPANCDASRLVLRANAGDYCLYDASSCALVRTLGCFSDCVQEPEPRWHRTDPDVFYYLCRAQLRSYDIDRDSSATIHDFRVEFPNCYAVTTKVEGDASLDRRYWCLMVEDSLFNLIAVVVYDRTADSIVGRQTGGFPDDLNWVSMDMTGDYCLIGFESLNYLQVWDRAMATATDLPAGTNAHGDLALNTAGEAVWVYQNTTSDRIACCDLATGSETPLLEIPFGVNPDIGLHFSGNCASTPGWVLVSTYGSYNPPPGSGHAWMDCQLFMLELDASPRVWRVAHTQSYTARDFDGDKNYFAEAFAAINTGGTRIYWGSNWRNYTAEYTDCYQVIMPESWAAEMPQ